MKRISPVVILALILGACGGGGGGSSSTTSGGGGGGEATTPTTISGKVTLSSAVAAKPAAKMSALSLPSGKPGSNRYQASKKSQSSGIRVPGYAAGDSVTNASVLLYDSDHPEYLYPIAQSETDAQGNYTLSVLSNAAQNGSGYTDDDPIPQGNYTLMAFKPGGFDPVLGVTTDPVVAVQTIVNEFTGDVTGNDLGAEPSDVLPSVEKMFGVTKNTDGTNTWGSSSVELAPNAAIQVSFSMAMSRGSISSGISISPAVDGYWSVSPDWLSATFYLNDGVQLTAGETYTVTVQVGDTNSLAVKNVYGNSVQQNAVGTFSVAANAVADTVAPTAIVASPLTPTDVDLVTPIRVASNELLDVNQLLLTSTPSLGAKPGVMYVGEEDGAGQFKYIYEFMLADPLDIATSYDISISGGKDLSGNEMNGLTYSFQTAATSTGIDATADATTQSAQADVKDVFGKWVRAMNDHNLAQLQAMMSGNFAMEYDVGRDGADENDVNRDGRYSLAEFSEMIKMAFTQWSYCGTTMSGDIPSNINVVGDTADFEFALTAASTVSSQDCLEAAPEDVMFAEVKKVNGSWLIARVGDGIDIRDKDLVVRDIIELNEPAHGASVSPVPVRDNTTGVVANPISFSWYPVDGASSYVFVILNSRDERLGRAYAVSNTPTGQDASGNTLFELALPFSKNSSGSSILPFGVVNITDEFDFDTYEKLGMQRPGEEFHWEVIGLGTNTLNDFEQGRANNLFRDIVAISRLNRYNNAGTFKDLAITVADTSSVTLPFSEFIDGYNAGAADQLVITITTPNGDAGNGGSSCGPGCFDGAGIRVHGHTEQGFPLTFDTNGQATATIDLNEGMNWVEVFDGVDLNRGFSVQTTGGIPAVIEITSVVDQLGHNYPLDQWDHVSSTDATSVTLSGTVTDSNIVDLNVNLWNDTLQANSFSMVQVSNGTFSVTMDIYQGENWINIADNNWFYQASLGIDTDAGSTYVAPIVITDVTDALQTENYGNSANWDASSDANDIVTITGSMETPDINASVHYRHHSPGGYDEGTLNFSADGSFSLDIELYNGWNGVDLEDGNGNWYGLQIFTSAGLTVPRPTIATIDGVAVTMDDWGNVVLPNGNYTTDQCTVTITGTSGMGAGSEVRAGWNGYDDTTGAGFWDEQKVVTDANDAFSVILPLQTGANNHIDINNEQWVWVGFPVETTGNCTYTPPTMSVDDVTDANGTSLPMDQFSGDLDAGNSATITINGTHSQVGRTVVASMHVCGTNVDYSAVVQTDNTFSITGITAYDGYNWVDVSDGPNWDNFNFISTSGQQPPPPPLQVDSVSFDDNTNAMQNWSGCDFADWNAPNATSVTVSGSTSAPPGTGTYNAGSQVGEFTIATDGSFSFSVNVFDGQNNIGINDTDWNFTGLNIQTNNGIQAPQFVYIDSPLQTDVVSGTVTVTGHLENFTPGEIWGDVWYEADSSNAFYHSNPIGDDRPLTFNSDGTFSFVVDNISGIVNIRVESCQGPVCHGQEIRLNDPNAGPSWHWKAGGSSDTNAAITEQIERVKSIQRVRSSH